MRRFALTITAAAALVTIVWLMRARSAPPATDGTGSAAQPGHEESAEPTGPVRLGQTDGHPLPEVLIDPRIRVEKARWALLVISDEEVVKTYRIALGRAPVGDTGREGDGRTPEGAFYVCTKNPASRYRLALGISYPNESAADRGLARGLITVREHRRILEAITRFSQPPWNTALGGEIMIHGGGTESDWTEGCIALTDRDIDELYPAIPLGTPVEIVP